MEANTPPKENSLSRLYIGNGDLFSEPRVKSFLCDASTVVGTRVALRKVAVRIDSLDPLTRQFQPPTANAVPIVLPRLLSLLSNSLASSKTPAETLLSAFIGYQVFLTLHPFCDGNGRVGRAIYAAALARNGVKSPAALLMLPLMLRNGAFAYHASSWSSRAGDYESLLTLMTSCFDHARSIWIKALDAHPESSLDAAFFWAVLRNVRRDDVFAAT